MRERLQAGLTSIVILSLFAIVIDASDNYTVNHGANQNITAHTECAKVTNGSATSASIYVPTQTSPEWESFRTNPPAGVTIGPCVVAVTVPSGTNLNLCTLAGNPTTAGNYVFTINAGTTINSSSSGSPSLTTGTCWVAGSSVTLVNNGNVYGRGGNGGTGARAGSAEYGVNGSAGGPAISLSYPVSINNINGYIFGGGGGGGGGPPSTVARATAVPGGGGGGGQGSVNSAGGALGPGNNYREFSTDGSAGTVNGPGAGGGPGISFQGGRVRGGNGGAWGAAGASGENGSGIDRAGDGGAGGKAIDTNGHAVTWLGGNNTTRVKGAVSN